MFAMAIFVRRVASASRESHVEYFLLCYHISSSGRKSQIIQHLKDEVGHGMCKEEVEMRKEDPEEGQ